MNIETARMLGRRCYLLALWMRRLPSGGVADMRLCCTKPGLRKSLLAKWLRVLAEFVLAWRLNSLIKIKDLEVRMWALKTLEATGIRSKHLGLVATSFVVKHEVCVKDANDRELFTGTLEHIAWLYFLRLLDVPNFFEELQASFDYLRGRLEDGLKAKIDFEWLIESINRYNVQDLRGIFGKQLSGYYEQQAAYVYQCLDETIGYVFKERLESELALIILERLVKIAAMGHFPEKWLVELAEKHAKGKA